MGRSQTADFENFDTFWKILYFFLRDLVAGLFDQCSYSRSKESTFHLTCSASQNISNLSYIVYIIRYQYNCQPELNHVLMLKLSYRTTLRCLKRGNDKRCISAFIAIGVRMDWPQSVVLTDHRAGYLGQMTQKFGSNVMRTISANMDIDFMWKFYYIIYKFIMIVSSVS